MLFQSREILAIFSQKKGLSAPLGAKSPKTPKIHITKRRKKQKIRQIANSLTGSNLVRIPGLSTTYNTAGNEISVKTPPRFS